MGGCCSKEKVYVPRTGLQKRLVDALQELAKAKQTSARRPSLGHFDRVILQFPKIRSAMRNVKEVFEKFDTDNSGTIDKEELQHAVYLLGAKMSVDDVNEMFTEARVTQQSTLNFKEFVTALCVGSILKLMNLEAPGARDGRRASSGLNALPSFKGEPVLKQHGKALVAALAAIVEAYMLFDQEKRGYIKKANVMRVLAERHKKGTSTRLAFLSEARWAEMDWDRDGTITFEEFLYSFLEWVGLDDESDSDDELRENTRRNSVAAEQDQAAVAAAAVAAVAAEGGASTGAGAGAGAGVGADAPAATNGAATAASS